MAKREEEDPAGLEDADQETEEDLDEAEVFRGGQFRLASAFEEMNALKRNTMEDAHVVMPDLLGDGTVSFLAVYDGHGGRGIVEFVEEHLHEQVGTELRANPENAEAALKTAFQICDAESKAMGVQTGGATAAVALVREEAEGRVLYTAGVGDSRIVLVRNGEAFRLTTDHRPDNVAEKRRVEAAGGFFMRERLLGILAVTRSFGDHGMKDFVSAEPETKRVPLTPEDTVVILACDGIWDVLTDQEAADLVLGMADTEEGKEDAARQLVETSIEQDTTDNVTAMVVFL